MTRRDSDHWARLVEEYRQYHIARPGLFMGRSTGHVSEDLRRIFQARKPTSVLDYGSGKAIYQRKHFPEIPWTFYDPAVPEFSELPSGTFDGVTCIDVLEHIHPGDIEWVAAEVIGKAKDFVFVNVCCLYGDRRLLSGELMHMTVRDPDWWENLLRPIAKAKDVLLVATYEEAEDPGC